MNYISNYLKRCFIAFLSLSTFDLMAVGVDIYIPLSLITVIFVSIFELSGFVALVILYVFII